MDALGVVEYLVETGEMNKRWERGVLLSAGLILLAAKLIIPLCGVFTPDGARDLAQAWRVATGERLLEGPQVGGDALHLGPGYFYLLALPLALGGSATVALCFLSLCTLTGTFFAYRLGTLLFDQEIGVAFALLFTADYWASFSSMSVSHIDLLPTICLGFLWGICAAFCRDDPRGLC